MESEDLRKDVEQLKIAQATQVATTAGAQATLAATQAGATSTLAATQAGLISTIVVGSVSLIVGIFLGLTIVKSKPLRRSNGAHARLGSALKIGAHKLSALSLCLV